MNGKQMEGWKGGLIAVIVVIAVAMILYGINELVEERNLGQVVSPVGDASVKCKQATGPGYCGYTLSNCDNGLTYRCVGISEVSKE